MWTLKPVVSFLLICAINLKLGKFFPPVPVCLPSGDWSPSTLTLNSQILIERLFVSLVPFYGMLVNLINSFVNNDPRSINERCGRDCVSCLLHDLVAPFQNESC